MRIENSDFFLSIDNALNNKTIDVFRNLGGSLIMKQLVAELTANSPYTSVTILVTFAQYPSIYEW